jgi:hypothetical protein
VAKVLVNPSRIRQQIKLPAEELVYPYADRACLGDFLVAFETASRVLISLEIIREVYRAQD